MESSLPSLSLMYNHNPDDTNNSEKICPRPYTFPAYEGLKGHHGLPCLSDGSNSKQVPPEDVFVRAPVSKDLDYRAHSMEPLDSAASRVGPASILSRFASFNQTQCLKKSVKFDKSVSLRRKIMFIQSIDPGIGKALTSDRTGTPRRRPSVSGRRATTQGAVSTLEWALREKSLEC